MSDFNLNMIGEVNYSFDSQVKQMNDYSFDMHAESSCTQLLGSNHVLKDVIKYVIEDVNQDATDNMCDMLVNELSTKRKEEQATSVNYNTYRRHVQTCKSETGAEANV